MGYPFSFGQRFICADKLQYALQKWVWPAGHLLSRRRERRQRGAKGTPLEPWMVLSAFFLGKPPHRGLLNQGRIPRRRFASFVAGDKGMWPRMGYSAELAVVLYADNPINGFFFPRISRGIPFLSPRKKGTRRAGREHGSGHDGIHPDSGCLNIGKRGCAPWISGCPRRSIRGIIDHRGDD